MNSRLNSIISRRPNISSLACVSLNGSCVEINQYIEAMPGMTIFHNESKKVIISRSSANESYKKKEIKLPDKKKR